MVNESATGPGAVTSGSEGLLNWLRDHPTGNSASELADRFQLPEAFVSLVLEGAARPSIALEGTLSPVAAIGRFRRLIGRICRALAWALDQTIPTVVITTLLGVSVAWVLNRLLADLPSGMISLARPISILATIIVTLTIQMVAYYRRSEIVMALRGTILVWAIASIGMVISVAVRRPERGFGFNQIQESLLAAVALAALAVGYAGISIIASLVGAWYRIRGVDEAEENMSRQQLMERYFELQRRLEQGAMNQLVSTWLDYSRPARWLNRHPVVCTIILFFGLSLLNGLTNSMGSGSATFAANDQQVSLTSSGGIHLVTGIMNLAARLTALVLVGLLCRGIGAAMGLGLVGGLTLYFAEMIPLGRPGGLGVFSLSQIVVWAIGIIICVIVAGFAGIASELNRRRLMDMRLANNDPATLMAEMVRIQWRLNDQAQDIAVVVVDVVKSRQMKAQADPLLVEYSFREYQEWIEREITPFGGRIHNTAGDGAVLAFDDCPSALGASRRLQTSIAEFNHSYNRLSSPFRIRVGIHVGTVFGDLHEVEFTEVIDIAAHIEEVAVADGIAISEAVRNRLPDCAVLPLAVPVDGTAVYLIANARED